MARKRRRKINNKLNNYKIYDIPDITIFGLLERTKFSLFKLRQKDYNKLRSIEDVPFSIVIMLLEHDLI